jgi:hypothetical protein
MNQIPQKTPKHLINQTPTTPLKPISPKTPLISLSMKITTSTHTRVHQKYQPTAQPIQGMPHNHNTHILSTTNPQSQGPRPNIHHPRVHPKNHPHRHTQGFTQNP